MTEALPRPSALADAAILAVPLGLLATAVALARPWAPPGLPAAADFVRSRFERADLVVVAGAAPQDAVRAFRGLPVVTAPGRGLVLGGFRRIWVVDARPDRERPPLDSLPDAAFRLQVDGVAVSLHLP